MHNRYDLIAIGDVATDAFIRLKHAEIQDNIDHTAKELCVNFGDKVPYESVKIVRGVGNSANVAVAAARLGLRTALIADVGNDQNGKECIGSLSENGVGIDYISNHEDIETNYHFVLWYGIERTILVKHNQYPYKLPKIQDEPGWIYLSSIGENSEGYHQEILSYLNEHSGIKLAFQPGTYQIKAGAESLRGIYDRTDLFFCNVTEAKRILKTEETDPKKLLEMLHALGPKTSVITDGLNGAYAFDGNNFLFAPVYSADAYERTGAGDAFAGAVTSALALGKTFEEAFMWGPVNAASVIMKIGAQEGLLTRDQLESQLSKAPAEFVLKKLN